MERLATFVPFICPGSPDRYPALYLLGPFPPTLLCSNLRFPEILDLAIDEVFEQL